MPGIDLNRITYVSRASAEFDEPALDRLGVHAAEKNGRVGLTGYLFYLAPYFVQYLEGPAAAVGEVFARIGTDPRHQIIRVLTLPSAGERLFPDWSMRSSGADHRHLPGWSTRETSPADASAVRLEHVLLSVLLHTSAGKLQSESVTQMVSRLFADLAEHERCALAQT